MEKEHQDLDKPIHGILRNLSYHYFLREYPKKKTQKSPESMKKILFRCEECGKGFRYEKCLSNHQAVMHLSNDQKVYKEFMMSLCSSFSLVRKKKRSRVIRYKKTPLSCSFTTFLESPSAFAAVDEELEVAECMILLSKSTPKFVDGLQFVAEAIYANPETPNGSYDSGCLRNKKQRKGGEFESGFFSDERVSSYETSKEPTCFLGDNNKSDQQKRRKAGKSESVSLSNEQNLLKEEITTHEAFKEQVSFLGLKSVLDQQKLRKEGGVGTGFLGDEQKLMEETWKEPVSFLGEKNVSDQRKLQKASDFESGFYRTELDVGAMESSNSDTEIITESDKKNVEHQCRLCNKIFSSYQALGGHQTFHRMSKSKNRKNCREVSVEPEDETVTKEKKTHKCSICSRCFRSVHALGGHKKCHGKRQHSGDEDLGFLSVVPVTVGMEFY